MNSNFNDYSRTISKQYGPLKNLENFEEDDYASSSPQGTAELLEESSRYNLRKTLLLREQRATAWNNHTNWKNTNKDSRYKSKIFYFHKYRYCRKNSKFSYDYSSLYFKFLV